MSFSSSLTSIGLCRVLCYCWSTRHCSCGIRESLADTPESLFAVTLWDPWHSLGHLLQTAAKTCLLCTAKAVGGLICCHRRASHGCGLGTKSKMEVVGSSSSIGRQYWLCYCNLLWAGLLFLLFEMTLRRIIRLDKIHRWQFDVCLSNLVLFSIVASLLLPLW